MSAQFTHDRNCLWGIIDLEQRLRPAPEIHHVYLIGVTTVGLSEDEQSFAASPFNRSGLALAPVVKGFPLVQFLRRQWRGGSR
jgi:hypothetical protein